MRRRKIELVRATNRPWLPVLCFCIMFCAFYVLCVIPVADLPAVFCLGRDSLGALTEKIRERIREKRLESKYQNEYQKEYLKGTSERMFERKILANEREFEQIQG